MKQPTQYYPNNEGRKWCALATNGQRKVTGWGDTEEEAISDAAERLSNHKMKPTKKRFAKK